MPKPTHVIGDIRYNGGPGPEASTTCACGWGPVPYREWEQHRDENNVSTPKGTTGRYEGQVWGTDAVSPRQGRGEPLDSG